jgi:hypothetical protein
MHMTGRKGFEDQADQLAPMNSEGDTQREVVILLSGELAPRMHDLALGHQVWAPRTPDTEEVAQRFWAEYPPLDAEPGSGGITLFAGQGDPESDFLSIFDEVELHYGIASAERPAVTVLRVLGIAASDSIREALRVQGFTAIKSRPDGFLARWHRE